MGWMAPRGSVGTALDASEAASGKSAPPLLHPSVFPVAPHPRLARQPIVGGEQGRGGGPFPHPTGAEDPTPGLQRGNPSHCEYLRPAVPSPCRDPKLDLGAAQRRKASL